jgi:hypothetical protein
MGRYMKFPEISNMNRLEKPDLIMVEDLRFRNACRMNKLSLPIELASLMLSSLL